MEACFLSSNPFTKTMETVPCISTWSRRKLGKVGRSFSITACYQSQSPEDEERLIINADWRSFRARLVAGEQAFKLKSEPSLVVSPIINISDKWVHTIHEPENGCLLIATEKLDGVHIFERTVVLLLSVGPIGPTGIILNRPSLMSIKEMRSSLTGTFSDRPLFFGGPLEEGLFLLNPGKESDDRVKKTGAFEQVMKGLYYGTKETVGFATEMVKRGVVGEGEFRFFHGYCAWEREQLRDEIREGYWTVAACSPTVIGLPTLGDAALWEQVHALM